jgi:hypothetical protein
MDDLGEYWPPRCTEDATKTLDENSLLIYNIVPFTYSVAEFNSFSSSQNVKGKKMLRSKFEFLDFSLMFFLGQGSLQDVVTSLHNFNSNEDEGSTASSQFNIGQFRKRIKKSTLKKSKGKKFKGKKGSTLNIDTGGKSFSPNNKHSTDRGYYNVAGIVEEESVPSSRHVSHDGDGDSSRPKRMRFNEKKKVARVKQEDGKPSFAKKFFNMIGCCTDR